MHPRLAGRQDLVARGHFLDVHVPGDVLHRVLAGDVPTGRADHCAHLGLVVQLRVTAGFDDRVVRADDVRRWLRDDDRLLRRLAAVEARHLLDVAVVVPAMTITVGGRAPAGPAGLMPGEGKGWPGRR